MLKPSLLLYICTMSSAYKYITSKKGSKSILKPNFNRKINLKAFKMAFFQLP